MKTDITPPWIWSQSIEFCTTTRLHFSIEIDFNGKGTPKIKKQK